MTDPFIGWDPEEALVMLVVAPLTYFAAFIAVLRLSRNSSLRTWIKVQLLIFVPLTAMAVLALVAGRIAR